MSSFFQMPSVVLAAPPTAGWRVALEPSYRLPVCSLATPSAGNLENRLSSYGETTDVPIEIPLPDTPGRYRLKLDLVSEGVDWFEACGSPTTSRALVVW